MVLLVVGAVQYQLRASTPVVFLFEVFMVTRTFRFVCLLTSPAGFMSYSNLLAVCRLCFRVCVGAGVCKYKKRGFGSKWQFLTLNDFSCMKAK